MLVFLRVAQHEIEVAELCMYVMRMLWIEEGAHLLYSFYSYFSIKKKWGFGEIDMWGEPSQKGSLKKAHFLCSEEAWKGRQQIIPFPLMISRAKPSRWDLLFALLLSFAIFPSFRNPPVLIYLKYFTLCIILMVTFFFFCLGGSMCGE